METSHKQTERKRNITAMLLLLIFIFTTLSLLIYLYPFASTKKETYFSDQHQILYTGSLYSKTIVKKGNVYIPVSFIKEQLDDAIYVDKKAIIFTTNASILHIPLQSEHYYKNNKKVKTDFPIVIEDGKEYYISLDIMTDYLPIKYHITKDTATIWIEKDGEKYRKGVIKDEKVHKAYLRLRTEPTLLSPYVKEVQANEKVRIESKEKNYYFVRTVDGIGGYIKKEFVQAGKEVKVKAPSKEEKVVLPKVKHPISLSWEAVYHKNPKPQSMPKLPGVNVISPTWFHLKDKKGKVENLASADLVKWAKKNKYQVWGLFSNSFDPTLTHEAFSHYQTRKKVIDQLVKFSKKYKLDGINIDIENVQPEDAELVTQFVREATARLHRAGMIVSMDITFISTGNWSEFYEREKLAHVVDYLIVMAYDEHWGGSETAGSVASLPWVEENLQQLLKIVPNDKLILGIPLYTRLWAEKSKNGETEITSEALSMEEAIDWMKKRDVQPVFDPSSEQHYVEYKDKKKNIVYKMWLEDEISLQKRAEIALKYHLAGVATWARAFGNEDAWVTLHQSLEQSNEKKSRGNDI